MVQKVLDIHFHLIFLALSGLYILKIETVTTESASLFSSSIDIAQSINRLLIVIALHISITTYLGLKKLILFNAVSYPWTRASSNNALSVHKTLWPFYNICIHFFSTFYYFFMVC